MLRFGPFELQPDRRRLLHDGNAVEIGARALDLLVALAERRDRIVAKSELLDLVWPGVVVEENNLQVQVSSLRKLLGPQAIATIPGRGYRFVAPLAEACESTGAGPSATSPGPAAAAAATPPSNLPAEPPALFGRSEDLALLRSLVQSHRLVTVVGAGGIGKTALARALGHELRAAFDDGVWLVQLAPLADATQIASTVAAVIEVALGAGSPTPSLVQALRTSRMLIIFDNCEHLLEGVAGLAAAIQGDAPGVHLLATSQEPLKIGPERVLRLGGLALPRAIDVGSARDSGAAALFEARANAAHAPFRLCAENVEAVVDICRQLDGIALAIELAAARVPLLGIDALRTRLGERLRLLTTGDRLAERRHRTLRAALEWSHGLLTREEQTVFARLGVFAGGFGLDSAQHVGADPGIDAWAVLDHLGALVDKSLVVTEPGPVPRYRLLETSRVFALEKLELAGETALVRRRHAEAMLAVFEPSLADEFVLPSDARLERYLPDLDNARAALEESARHEDATLHVALAGALGWFWLEAGLAPEGARRTRAAMERIGPGVAPRLEARLLQSWAWLAHPSVGADELAANARAVAIYRQLGDRRALFTALSQQARFQPYCGELEEAEAALDEAEQLFDPTWPRALRMPYLKSRAYLYDVRGRLDEACALGEEQLQLATALGDKRLVLNVKINLEQTLAALGRLEESVARNRELVEVMNTDRTLRRCNEHFVLKNLHMSLVRLGHVEEALQVARVLQPLLERAGRGPELLEPCALLLLKSGRIDDAARLAGRGSASFAALDFRRDPVEQLLCDELLLGLREARSPSELKRLMNEGSALSDDEALCLAFADAT